MDLYPMMVNLVGKNVLIVGGGKVARRRVHGLLNTGATISIVSPTLDMELQSLYKDGAFLWISREFEPADVKNAFLVIAATNNREVNQRVSQVVSCHQLVNVVDHHDEGSVHIPAMFSRGPLMISISTNGASPHLTKKIRRQLADIYDESFEDYLVFLNQARRLVKKLPMDQEEKSLLLQHIVEDSYLHSKEKQQLFFERMSGKYEQSRKEY